LGIIKVSCEAFPETRTKFKVGSDGLTALSEKQMCVQSKSHALVSEADSEDRIRTRNESRMTPDIWWQKPEGKAWGHSTVVFRRPSIKDFPKEWLPDRGTFNV